MTSLKLLAIKRKLELKNVSSQDAAQKGSVENNILRILVNARAACNRYIVRAFLAHEISLCSSVGLCVPTLEQLLCVWPPCCECACALLCVSRGKPRQIDLIAPGRYPIRQQPSACNTRMDA